MSNTLSPHHDSRGKFLPGNRAAAGATHQLASLVVKLRQAFLDAITPEDMTRVTLRHLDLIQSKDGKVAVAALTLLYDRLFGKARETLDLSVTQAAPLDPASYSDAQLEAVIEVLANPAKPQALPQ